MAAFDSYDKLVTAIKDWINRSDLDSVIPHFISLAESRMSRTLRVPSMERRVILDTTEGISYIPVDLLEVKSMYYIGGDCRQVIERTNTSKVNDLIQSTGEVTGIPKFFSRMDNQFIFGPKVADGELTPVDGTGAPLPSTAVIELEYYQTIPSLITGSPTFTADPDGSNWVLDMAPECYLFGALHEASIYVKDLDRAQYWKMKFEEGIMNLQKMGDQSEYAGSELAVYYQP